MPIRVRPPFPQGFTLVATDNCEGIKFNKGLIDPNGKGAYVHATSSAKLQNYNQTVVYSNKICLGSIVNVCQAEGQPWSLALPDEQEGSFKSCAKNMG